MEPEKIVVVKKATPLEELMQQHTTASQAKFFLESRGESYDSYKRAHDAYTEGLKRTIALIPTTMRRQLISRENLATFQFSDGDLVAVVGDAGLLVNVAKYLGEQPVIMVNPDNARFDDVFTTCVPENFGKMLGKTLEDEVNIDELAMAECVLEDGQRMLALNDLYVGRKTHVSSRYCIEHDGKKEMQSSDGIVISTGTGSTGWLSSIVNGARAIAGGNSGLIEEIPFEKYEDHLVFAVMNPFVSKISNATIVYGRITEENPLVVVSNMPKNGVIFGDGVEEDYIDFSAGKKAIIRPADRRVNLVKGEEE